MPVIVIEPTFEAWRVRARSLILAGVKPDDVQWRPKQLASESRGLAFGEEAEAPLPEVTGSGVFRVPRAFVDLARKVSFHRGEERWPLLYRVLWRLQHENSDLLAIHVDDDIRTLATMERSVSRDAHKMKAFVRFRKLPDQEEGIERFMAWHEPEHPIVRYVAPFFARRFAVMQWAIVTPDESVAWDGQALAYGPGAPRQVEDNSELETLWGTYYASIFNPARIKLGAMRKEMPTRYWATMPETALIPGLLQRAEGRVAAMGEAASDSAAAFVPATGDLPELREAAQHCRGCDLYRTATQTVFGVGPLDAGLVLVGEQPGDQEDLAGTPFVGPAGRLLDRALRDAGLDRSQLYLTNAVKHFKHEQTGKLRLHKRPEAREVSACRPWLVAEMSRLRPRVLVCLGLTAARAVMGRLVRLGDERSKVVSSTMAPATIITIHPSAILRMPDAGRQAAEYAALVRDLILAKTTLEAATK